MATVESKDDIRDLLKTNRWDSGDVVTSIYKYVTPDSPDKKVFACYAEYDPDPKAPLKSPYVKNPVLLMWNGELTREGKEWLTNNSEVLKRKDQLNEIVRLAYICSAANKELESEHGIENLGLDYFNENSRAYLTEARDVNKPLEDYINGLSESDLAQIEAIMYFGRDHEGVHWNDLARIRKQLEPNRSGVSDRVSDLVRNITEKCNNLPVYFSQAHEKANEDGIDLNQEF